jgi:hypothetical protein
VALGSVSLFFRIPLREIGYVRAVIDGHEGLATVRAVDPDRGEIEWLVPEPRVAEARALAAALRGETGLCEIPRPPDWDPL